MSHPSLGLPPPDSGGRRTDAGRRVRESAARLAARALAVAMDADRTLGERYDEDGLRARLHDAELLAERLALALDLEDPTPMREYADWVSPTYRRKKVPLGDLMALCEGLRTALPDVLAPGQLPTAGAGPRRGDRDVQVASPPRRRRAQEERLPPVPVQGRLTR